jgi:hypothetical protein
VSGVTGLRTDVSGWGYATRNQASWTTIRGSFLRTRFWDPARLERELQLIANPTRPSLATAYRQGTRWIVADEAFGPVSPRLAELSDQQFNKDGVHVYRLRPG